MSGNEKESQHLESPPPENTSPDPSFLSVSERLNLAKGLHAAGRLAEAEKLYQQVLDDDPTHPVALHFLGVIALQSGKHEQAVELITKAISIKPDFAEAYNNLGTALKALRRYDEAISAYQQSLIFKPDFTDAHYNLGFLMQQMNRPGEAVSHFHQVIAIHPNRVDAHGGLGLAYKALGRLNEAVASYQKALTHRPDSVSLCIELGLLLQQSGDPEGAVGIYKKILMIQPDHANALFNLGKLYHELGQLNASVESYQKGLHANPERADALCNLGLALQDLGRMDEALASYHQAITINPGLLEAHYNLGNALQSRKKLNEAILSYQKALEINPGFVQALNNIGAALNDLGRLDEAVEIYQSVLQDKPDYAEGHNNLGNSLFSLGDIEASISCYQKAIAEHPDYYGAFSNLLLAEQYRPGHTAETLYELHCRWDERYALTFKSAWPNHQNTREPDRTLRIGFVSADLGRHPVGYFAVGLLEHLRQFNIETFCYSDRIADDLTKRIQSLFNVWHNTRDASDEAVTSIIAQDKIDILIDLSGHSAHNRLLIFARKPAPIQVSWAGYVSTTGLSAMDYLVSDRFSTLEGEEPFYSEKIIRMPDQWLCYEPPSYAPDVAPLPAQKNGYVTFGSFSNPGKLNAAVVSTWAKILCEVEGSRLLIKYRGIDTASNIKRLTKMFGEAGIPASRLILEGRSPHADLLARYNDVDIALDPFPYSGGLTTYEALWMGVPVITIPGETFASRHSQSHLETIGHSEFVARDLDHYVGLAVEWAHDTDRLSKIRSKLREEMARSPICDHKKFSENFAVLMRTIWREWCERPFKAV